MKQALRELKNIEHKVYQLYCLAYLLEWDQEICMPEKGTDTRARQQALLKEYSLELAASERVDRLLTELGVHSPGSALDLDLPWLDRAFLRKARQDYLLLAKTPPELAGEISRQASLAHTVWIKAKKTSDFASFAPHLEKIVGLLREQADCIGYQDHPYDALLSLYDPEMTCQKIDGYFDRIKAPIKDLLDRIRDKSGALDVPEGDFPRADQEALCHRLLTDMGFDLKAGRLDETAHPYTLTMGPRDIRLTTRYKPREFLTGFLGALHEGGHGLYEQGFDPALAENILAQAPTYALHESISRFWENHVGRSLPFWQAYLPVIRSFFPDQLTGDTPKTMYRLVNQVRPSLIRVDADEVTYPLHIILRVDLEKALIAGELKVKDLPGAWNDGLQRLLGITVPDDSHGVLQDIHWSNAAFGYFFSYAQGDMYAAQLRAAMERDIPSLDDHIAAGRLTVPGNWLKEKILKHGAAHTPEELMEKAAGERLNPDFYVQYLREKYKNLYQL